MLRSKSWEAIIYLHWLTSNKGRALELRAPWGTEHLLHRCSLEGTKQMGGANFEQLPGLAQPTGLVAFPGVHGVDK